MIVRIKNSVSMIAIIAVTLSSSGCAALLFGAAAGAAGAVYVRGNLEKSFNESVGTLHELALSALQSEGVFVSQDTLNVHDATLVGEYEDGEGVKVSVNAVTEKSCKVNIRVGVFGDQVKSNAIMNAIEGNI